MGTGPACGRGRRRTWLSRPNVAGDEVVGGFALDDLNVQFDGAVAESTDLFDGVDASRVSRASS